MRPADHELEASTLGLALIDRAAHASVAELPDEVWDLAAHRTIARVLRLIQGERQDADVSLVVSALKQTGALQTVGGLPYLAGLMDAAGLAANHEGAVARLRDLAARRRVVDAAERAIASAASTDALSLARELEASLAEIETSGSHTVVLASDAIDRSLRWLERVAQPDARRIDVRFTSLRKTLLPWEPGELVVLGARPSTGKTAFALDLVGHVASCGNGALFASLETSVERITARQLATAGGTSLEAMRRGSLDSVGWEQVTRGAEELAKLNLGHVDAHELRVADLRAAARAHQRRHGLELVAIDYLQLLRGDKGARYGNRQEEIASISRSLKGLARELGIVVVALSQLNRTNDKDERRPRLSDLRESGQIEQDADCVILMSRAPDGVLFEIAKQKDGGLGEVVLSFQPHTMTFSDPDEHEPRGYAARIGAAPPRAIQPHYSESAYDDDPQYAHDYNDEPGEPW